jgi:ATP-binding cassette, subfamily C, bacterial EexD
VPRPPHPHRPTYPSTSPTDELGAALKASRGSFLFAGLFSMFINLMLLAPALYMLQVYDRVLTSGSQSTLLMLTLLVLGLYALMGALDILRSRVLVRISGRLDLSLNARLFMASFDAGLRSGQSPGSQPLQDLSTLRGFLTGSGLFGFFDAPWIPVYMAVLFFLHPLIGWVALGGAAVLIVLAIANEVTTRGPLGQANKLAIASNRSIENNLRNAEALEAMGMAQNLHRRWLVRHLETLRLQGLASDRAGLLTNASKSLRIMLQSLVLGVGAYLAVQHIVTPGVMIAGSILMGRALAPVDMLINTWKGFLSARAAYGRLRNLLEQVPARQQRMRLPAPQGRLTLENVLAIPPGGKAPALRNLSLELSPGEVVGVVGPSAAGKSTLARVMLGVWPVANGAVRLDGVDINVWNRDELGPSVGYLPQDVELFDGSVKANIARFGDVDAAQVVAAAERAGADDMIHQLPDAYDTEVGASGAVLSGGQRQRLGLARAMYGKPVLVVLDEPNSNLDDHGEAALTRAIATLRADGATVVLITHRPAILATVDKILVLRDGMAQAFGPRDEILPQLIRPRPQPAPAVRAVEARGGGGAQ